MVSFMDSSPFAFKHPNITDLNLCHLVPVGDGLCQLELDHRVKRCYFMEMIK